MEHMYISISWPYLHHLLLFLRQLMAHLVEVQLPGEVLEVLLLSRRFPILANNRTESAVATFLRAQPVNDLVILVVANVGELIGIYKQMPSLRCLPQLHQRRRLRHPAPHSPALQCRVQISRRKFANFRFVENCGIFTYQL